MSYPTVKLGDRHIIVVSGFKAATDAPGRAGDPVIIDEVTLKAVAAANKDAVAFGYVHGKWFPAA